MQNPNLANGQPAFWTFGDSEYLVGKMSSRSNGFFFQGPIHGGRSEQRINHQRFQVSSWTTGPLNFGPLKCEKKLPEKQPGTSKSPVWKGKSSSKPSWLLGSSMFQPLNSQGYKLPAKQQKKHIQSIQSTWKFLETDLLGWFNEFNWHRPLAIWECEFRPVHSAVQINGWDAGSPKRWLGSVA